jgi:hypothetical protein
MLEHGLSLVCCDWEIAGDETATGQVTAGLASESGPLIVVVVADLPMATEVAVEVPTLIAANASSERAPADVVNELAALPVSDTAPVVVMPDLPMATDVAVAVPTLTAAAASTVRAPTAAEIVVAAANAREVTA